MRGRMTFYWPVLLLWMSSAWAVPDMYKLSNSTLLMGPEEGTHKIHKSWSHMIEFMKDVDVYDEIVHRIEKVICGEQANKSVLLIGEPDDTYRYIFAKLATRSGIAQCQRLWHFDVDISKVEAGHRYVGDVEKYWDEYLVGPVSGKGGVLYFSGLGRLIGLGSHSQDETGIEQEYSNNLMTGQIRAVSFIDKYEYQGMLSSRHSYVFNSHEEIIKIPALSKELLKGLAQKWISKFGSHLTLNDGELEFLIRSGEYYQPNLSEPARTMSLVKHLISNQGDVYELMPQDSDIHTPSPYPAQMLKQWEIHIPDAKEIAISFDYFQTYDDWDTLQITEADTGKILQTMHGRYDNYKTRFFATNHLRLTFKSNTTYQSKGFKIKQVVGRKKRPYTLTRNDVREAIFTLVQVPKWLLTRDFTLIRNLPRLLDEDVVGIHDAKRDILRAIENGFVSGRTDEKPVASSLLVGPTGTGKTYIAKKVAEFMRLRLITFDMTQYRTSESFDRFQNILSNSLITNPYAVYLFEEIDKSATEVLDRLFFMMDEGIFYDRHQRPIFARGAVIMMTTNASSRLIIDERDNPELKRLVNLELQKTFRLAFLNRFDTMSIFKPFTDSEYLELAKVMTSKKVEKLEQYFGWKLNVDESVIKYMAINGQSALFGARPMERTIENVITTGLTKYNLNVAKIEAGDKISIVKDASSENAFKITVSGSSQGSFVYLVDLDNNSGKKEFSLDRFQADLNTVLYQSRMF